MSGQPRLPDLGWLVTTDGGQYGRLHWPAGDRSDHLAATSSSGSEHWLKWPDARLKWSTAPYASAREDGGAA